MKNMNALELSVKKAIQSDEKNSAANKAYLEFLKANFIIPIEKQSKSNQPEVLFLIEKEQTFLPVFSSKQHLDAWAKDIQDAISILSLSGVDLLKGIGDNVIVALNPGSEFYKEFNPSEVMRMKKMVLKIFK